MPADTRFLRTAWLLPWRRLCRARGLFAPSAPSCGRRCDAGFDPVEAGPLPQARRFDPGTAVFDSGMSGSQVRTAIGIA
jgi:hypothetical protein